MPADEVAPFDAVAYVNRHKELVHSSPGMPMSRGLWRHYLALVAGEPIPSDAATAEVLAEINVRIPREPADNITWADITRSETAWLT